MTIAELMARKRAELDTARGRRDAAVNRHNQLADQLRELRSNPSANEAAARSLLTQKDRASAEIDAQDVILDRLRDEHAELRAEEIADEKVDALARQSHPTAAATVRQSNGQEAIVSTVSVRESRTYTADKAQAGDVSFVRDLWRAHRGDPEASTRLYQHGVEARTDQPQLVERAVNTGGVAAFVPPQYLVDLFATYLRAGRPTVNLCTRDIPLPETGMVVNIPRITTGSATAVQASQNTSIGTTDIDDTTLAVPVVTIAGYVDVARQALERGELVEQMVLADLAADYASRLDAQVLNGAGTSGEHLGILGTAGIGSVTYTDASPTLGELWPKIADAIGRVQSTRFTGPTAIVMRPNVWAWIMSTLASDGRPLVVADGAGPSNAVGVSTGVDYSQVVGKLQGIPVVLDGNIPANLGAGTNETAIIVGDFRDAFAMEEQDGMPSQLRFDDVGSANLTSRLLAYGYSAFTAGRQPTAFAKITGTGLIVPAL